MRTFIQELSHIPLQENRGSLTDSDMVYPFEHLISFLGLHEVSRLATACKVLHEWTADEMQLYHALRDQRRLLVEDIFNHYGMAIELSDIDNYLWWEKLPSSEKLKKDLPFSRQDKRIQIALITEFNQQLNEKFRQLKEEYLPTDYKEIANFFETVLKQGNFLVAVVVTRFFSDQVIFGTFLPTVANLLALNRLLQYIHDKVKLTEQDVMSFVMAHIVCCFSWRGGQKNYVRCTAELKKIFCDYLLPAFSPNDKQKLEAIFDRIGLKLLARIPWKSLMVAFVEKSNLENFQTILALDRLTWLTPFFMKNTLFPEEIRRNLSFFDHEIGTTTFDLSVFVYFCKLPKHLQVKLTLDENLLKIQQLIHSLQEKIFYPNTLHRLPELTIEEILSIKKFILSVLLQNESSSLKRWKNVEEINKIKKFMIYPCLWNEAVDPTDVLTIQEKLSYKKTVGKKVAEQVHLILKDFQDLRILLHKNFKFSEKNILKDLSALMKYKHSIKFLGREISFIYIDVLKYPAFILPLLDQPITIKELIEKISKYKNCLCLLLEFQGNIIQSDMIEHILKIWTLQEFEENRELLKVLIAISLFFIKKNEVQKLKDFLNISDSEFKKFFQELFSYAENMPYSNPPVSIMKMIDVGYERAKQVFDLVKNSKPHVEKFLGIIKYVSSSMIQEAIQTCCQTGEEIDPVTLDRLLTDSPLTLLWDVMQRAKNLFNCTPRLSYEALHILCDSAKTSENLELCLEYLDKVAIQEKSLLPLIQQKDFFEKVQVWKQQEPEKNLKRSSIFLQVSSKQQKTDDQPSPRSTPREQDRPGLG